MLTGQLDLFDHGVGDSRPTASTWTPPPPWRPGDDDPAFAETIRFGTALWQARTAGLGHDARCRQIPHGGIAHFASRGDSLQWRRKDGKPAPGTGQAVDALCAGLAAALGGDDLLKRARAALASPAWVAPLDELAALLAEAAPC